ncbi:MAG: nuclear transport factor 2 family protein [Acidobacteria bacterium ACB2]|nr:nuclear transport factor 2 family protein [Acidobacteria bacterium ACB2]
MSDEHPARAASRRSMEAVVAGDKDAWLENFADDAIVEDPIGASPLDPEGRGHRGKEAIAGFWDANIGPNKVSFEIAASYVAGNEVANVGSIITTFPDLSQVVVEGVFCYRVGDDGRLSSLRTYWELEKVRFVPAGED